MGEGLVAVLMYMVAFTVISILLKFIGKLLIWLVIIGGAFAAYIIISQNNMRGDDVYLIPLLIGTIIGAVLHPLIMVYFPDTSQEKISGSYASQSEVRALRNEIQTFNQKLNSLMSRDSVPYDPIADQKSAHRYLDQAK